MAGLTELLESSLRTGSPLAYAAAFGGGVLTSLTPCVYPLVPVTVGIVGGRALGSVRRGILQSLAYVLGMAAVYAALGAAAALSGRIFGTVGASPWTHLLLGVLCLLFGLSLFDLFPVPLPGFSAAPGAGSRTPGVGGAFVAGAASGLVVGPCTAPVLGALLVFVGSHRSVLFGTSLLFTFALGMGTLLLVAGTFSGFLSSLPRPGRWLVAVKRAFAVVMILSAAYLFVRAGALFP